MTPTKLRADESGSQSVVSTTHHYIRAVNLAIFIESETMQPNVTKDFIKVFIYTSQ